MTAHVFVGPSGRHLTVPPEPWFEWHDPIGHGDLLRLDLGPGDVVGIVDGVFYDRPAVRHAEILWAAGRGARVIGGCSMGALRAADLAGHGVDGVGQVFEWLRSGRVAADHEVAVLHGDRESGFRPMSIALVSVRHALDRLVARGAVDRGRADGVLTRLGDLYFADRTLNSLEQACTAALVPPDVTAELLGVIEGPDDVKMRDAAAVVAAVAAAHHDAAGTPPVPWRPEPTDNHATWVREAALCEAARGELAESRAVQAVQLFSGRAGDLYAGAVVTELAAEWSVEPTPQAIGREFGRRLGAGGPADDVASWWLAPVPDESREHALHRLAVASYRVTPSLPAWGALADRMRSVDGFGAVVDALAALPMTVDRATAAGPVLDRRVVTTWTARQWRCDPDPDVLRREAYARGFADLDDALRVAGRFLAANAGAGVVGALLGELA